LIRQLISLLLFRHVIKMEERIRGIDEQRRYEHMKGWTNDDRIMIACCNDGTRPVIFKIERTDIPENDEEREELAK